MIRGERCSPLRWTCFPRTGDHWSPSFFAVRTSYPGIRHDYADANYGVPTAGDRVFRPVPATIGRCAPRYCLWQARVERFAKPAATGEACRFTAALYLRSPRDPFPLGPLPEGAGCEADWGSCPDAKVWRPYGPASLHIRAAAGIGQRILRIARPRSGWRRTPIRQICAISHHHNWCLPRSGIRNS